MTRSGEDARPPAEEAGWLARKLAALPEAAMRVAVLLEYLQRADAELAAPVLADIHARGRMGGPPFDVAMLALATVLGGDALSYELRAALYKAAKQADLQDLAQLFFSSREADLPPWQLEGPPRELTLGHRKWMARDTRRAVLEKLIHNPEPEVMENLLKNPHLTEKDVIRMGSRRPVPPAVLADIFHCERWICRYGIKRTLLLNPYTPTEISLRLLSFMTRTDLRLVSTLSTLPRVVMEAAARMLRSR